MAIQDILGSGVGPSGGAVMFSSDSFETDPLDLTQPLLGIEIVPSRPNHIPLIVASFWLIESTSGTQTTPIAYNAGSDPAHTNYSFTAGTPSNANVNGAAPPSLASGPIEGVFPHNVVPGAPIIMDITSGAQGTGGFTLKARLCMTIIWAAVG